MLVIATSYNIHAITSSYDCNKPGSQVRQGCEAIPVSFAVETNTVSAGEEGRVAILCSSKTFAVN